jgi:xylulokinase
VAGRGSYLGLDLGTSGVKAALLDEEGRPLAEAEAAYDVTAPRAGWAEADPSAWLAGLTAVVGGLAEAIRSAPPRAVGLAGQMHGVVLCDGVGTPLRPAVLWPDRRADPELVRWRGLPATEKARLANPVVPGMMGPMLCWLAEHEPEVLEQAEVALLPKDVVRAALAGPPVTDRSDASATLLWDVVDDDWARSVAERIGVPAALLPRVVASDQVVGRTSWLARVVAGAPSDVPVVAGAGDTPAALLAVGTAGELQVNLGTGAQVLLPGALAKAAEDPVAHLYADTDGGWYAMVAVQNAGLAVEWARRLLGLEWSDLVAALATPGTPGALSFLPFLTGERGRLARPGSRGAWLGLEQSTTREDLARAAVQAMAFSVRRAVELLPRTTASADGAVRLTGGGTRAPAVQQLLADALGVAVQRVDVRSASATGAAVLAARGVGAVLVPWREQGVVVEPRRRPELDAAYRLWLQRNPVADL